MDRELRFFDSNIDPRLLIIAGIIDLLLILLINFIYSLIFLLLLHLLILLALPQRKILPVVIVSLITTIFVSFFYLFSILNENDYLITILRFLNFNFLFSWFFQSINPYELTNALIWFKIPYSFAWSISSSFRFITLFQNETQTIISAQLLRGIPLDGNVVQKFRYIPSIIIPLFYRVSIRTKQFYSSLYLRDWNPWDKKTRYKPLNIKNVNNYFWILVITCVFAITVSLKLLFS